MLPPPLDLWNINFDNAFKVHKLFTDAIIIDAYDNLIGAPSQMSIAYSSEIYGALIAKHGLVLAKNLEMKIYYWKAMIRLESLVLSTIIFKHLGMFEQPLETVNTHLNIWNL